MVDAKTGVVTHINKIESHAHLTNYHGHDLHLVVIEIIKATKIMRGTLDVGFEFNKLQILSKKVSKLQNYHDIKVRKLQKYAFFNIEMYERELVFVCF